MLLSEAEARKRYGPIIGLAWLAESKWCVKIAVPTGLGSNWINSATGLPVTHLYVNNDMAIALLSALQKVRDRGLASELKTFDGCFNVRDVRGEPGRLSTHAYALAIDLNASENALGTEGALSDRFAACFTEEGFIWGKTFARKDPMHFQFAAW